MNKLARMTTFLVILTMSVTMLGTPVRGQDSKDDRELAAQAQRIDKAAAPTDANRVTMRILDEWSGTQFKFDATSAPRPLTAQDIQDLRGKGLGFGEISILLALAAHQPNPATAKPLNEILALRQSKKGWGELAHELGVKNLGLVISRVKATEKGIGQVAKPLSPDEQRNAAQLRADADRLNSKAAQASSTSEGAQKVVSALAKEFKVPEGTVMSLREQKKLGFGEIAIVLSLAQEVVKRDKVPFDVAINRIMARREAGAGWGEIAHDLDLKLGNVVSDIKKAEKLVVPLQKADRLEPANKGESPGVGQPEKIEKPVTPERPERVERPERPEKPGKL